MLLCRIFYHGGRKEINPLWIWKKSENAKSLPDSSIMLELCGLLDINVNELLTGEKITMNEYDKYAEENLLEMKKREETMNRKLLSYEWVIGFGATVAFLVMMYAACFGVDNRIWQIVLITTGAVIFIAGAHFSLKIEVEAGYYVCKKCSYRHIPSYTDVLLAPHIGRTRYMKCPHCQEKNWQKKVLTK